MRGVTHLNSSIFESVIISTHTPHARRDCALISSGLSPHISTHTPHARRDGFDSGAHVLILHISTHTPHARRDCRIMGNQNKKAQFQLTRLMRGVTRRYYRLVSRFEISTHTPHARRDGFF